MQSGEEFFFWPPTFIDKTYEAEMEKQQALASLLTSQQGEDKDNETKNTTDALANRLAMSTSTDSSLSASIQKSGVFKHFNNAGTSSIAFNSTKKVFAIGEKNIDPKVHIFSYHKFKFKLLKTLFHMTGVEYNDLAFSRDGEYLAVLGSLPDHRLTIWDWENQKKFEILFFYMV